MQIFSFDRAAPRGREEGPTPMACFLLDPNALRNPHLGAVCVGQINDFKSLEDVTAAATVAADSMPRVSPLAVFTVDWDDERAGDVVLATPQTFNLLTADEPVTSPVGVAPHDFIVLDADAPSAATYAADVRTGSPTSVQCWMVNANYYTAPTNLGERYATCGCV